MRVRILLCGMATAACVGPQAVQHHATGEIAISLARDNSKTRPTLLATMTNRSQGDVCIRAELLKNPYSYSMDIRLQDSTGRSVKFKEPGYLDEPIMDPVRIGPGESVVASYFLDTRFKLPDGGQSLPKGMSARATLRYDSCDGSLSQQAISSWQRI